MGFWKSVLNFITKQRFRKPALVLYTLVIAIDLKIQGMCNLWKLTIEVMIFVKDSDKLNKPKATKNLLWELPAL